MMRSLAVVLMALALTVPAGAAQDSTKRPPAAEKPAMASPINLNTTVAQLESLPGIGGRTAERIVEYRQKNSSFKKVEEILEVLRSCPSLLRIPQFDARRPVSDSRWNPQEISR
jgi:competence protein ComEA